MTFTRGQGVFHTGRRESARFIGPGAAPDTSYVVFDRDQVDGGLLDDMSEVATGCLVSPRTIVAAADATHVTVLRRASGIMVNEYAIPDDVDPHVFGEKMIREVAARLERPADWFSLRFIAIADPR